jgi:hypothetical protein
MTEEEAEISNLVARIQDTSSRADDGALTMMVAMINQFLLIIMKGYVSK